MVYYLFHCWNCPSFGQWKLLPVGLYVPLAYLYHFVFLCYFKICAAVTHEYPVLYCAFFGGGGCLDIKTSPMLVLAKFHVLGAYCYHPLFPTTTASYMVSELAFWPPPLALYLVLWIATRVIFFKPISYVSPPCINA